MYRPGQNLEPVILANSILLQNEQGALYLCDMSGKLSRCHRNQTTGEIETTGEPEINDENRRTLRDMQNNMYAFKGSRVVAAPVNSPVTPQTQGAMPWGAGAFTAPAPPSNVSNPNPPFSSGPNFGRGSNFEGNSAGPLALFNGNGTGLSTTNMTAMLMRIAAATAAAAPPPAAIVAPPPAVHIVDVPPRATNGTMPGTRSGDGADETRPLLPSKHTSDGSSTPAGGRWCWDFLSSHSVDNTVGLIIGGGLTVINHLILMQSSSKISLSGLSYSFMACFVAGFTLGNLLAYEIRKRAADKAWCPITTNGSGVRQYYCGNLFATPKAEVLAGIGSGAVSAYFAYFQFLSSKYNDTLFAGSIAATIGLACALTGNRAVSHLRNKGWFLKPDSGSEICKSAQPYCEPTCPTMGTAIKSTFC